jgi:predicted nuclease of predicted toxin-antitoxin system
MKFLLDENAEFRLASFLQARGHDVKVIAHDYPGGLSDDQVLFVACEEQRVLITNDRDFGELIFRQRLPHCGVIFFRLSDQAIATTMARLDHLLRTYLDQLDQFVVVMDRTVRVRRSQ